MQALGGKEELEEGARGRETASERSDGDCRGSGFTKR